MMNGWTYMTQVGHNGMVVGMGWAWWLFWVAAVIFVVWAVARMTGGRGKPQRDPTPEQAAEATLRRRFAKGEIDEEEFTRRMEVLRDTFPVG